MAHTLFKAIVNEETLYYKPSAHIYPSLNASIYVQVHRLNPQSFLPSKFTPTTNTRSSLSIVLLTKRGY